MTGAIFVVHGGKELEAAFDHMGEKVDKGVRAELIATGEAMAKRAESNLKRAGVGPKWRKTRVGAARIGVYLAPVANKTSLQARKRPQFAEYLNKKGYEPASQIGYLTMSRKVDRIIDRYAREEGF